MKSLFGAGRKLFALFIVLSALFWIGCLDLSWPDVIRSVATAIFAAPFYFLITRAFRSEKRRKSLEIGGVAAWILPFLATFIIPSRWVGIGYILFSTLIIPLLLVWTMLCIVKLYRVKRIEKIGVEIEKLSSLAEKVKSNTEMFKKPLEILHQYQQQLEEHASHGLFDRDLLQKYRELRTKLSKDLSEELERQEKFENLMKEILSKLEKLPPPHVKDISKLVERAREEGDLNLLTEAKSLLEQREKDLGLIMKVGDILNEIKVRIDGLKTLGVEANELQSRWQKISQKRDKCLEMLASSKVDSRALNELESDAVYLRQILESEERKTGEILELYKAVQLRVNEIKSRWSDFSIDVEGLLQKKGWDKSTLEECLRMLAGKKQKLEQLDQIQHRISEIISRIPSLLDELKKRNFDVSKFEAEVEQARKIMNGVKDGMKEGEIKLDQAQACWNTLQNVYQGVHDFMSKMDKYLLAIDELNSRISSLLKEDPNIFVEDVKEKMLKIREKPEESIMEAQRLLVEKEEMLKRRRNILSEIKTLDERLRNLSFMIAEGKIDTEAFRRASDELETRKRELKEEIAEIDSKLYREEYEKPVF